MSGCCGHHQDQLPGTLRGHFTLSDQRSRCLGAFPLPFKGAAAGATFPQSKGNSLCGMTLGGSQKKGSTAVFDPARRPCQKASKSVKGLSVVTRPGPTSRSLSPNPQAHPKYFSLREMRGLQGLRVALAGTAFGSGERDALIGHRRGHV
jgi:hypothetical protein